MYPRTNRMESNMPQWRQFAPTAFLAILGAVVSGILFWAAYSWEMRSIRGDFDALADARCKEVSSAFKETATLLDFMDNVFNIRPRVTSPAFAGYLRYLKKLLEEDQVRHPEIISIIWAPQVSDAERAEYEQAAQTAIDASFQIGKVDASENKGPAEGRSQQFPIYLRAAAKGDRDNLGEDITLDADARDVIKRSGETGTSLAIAPIKMPAGAGGDFGYRIFQPLYYASFSGDTKDRRQNLTGFVCIDLDIGRLIGNAMKNIKPVGIDFRVCDNSEGNSVILCEHSSRLSSPLAAGKEGLNEFESNWATEFFGRKVLIECRSAQAFWIGRTIWQPWVVLFGGLAITLLVAGHQLNHVFRTRAVERAVTRRIARIRNEFEQVQQAAQEWDTKPSLAELTGGELQGTAVVSDITNDDCE